MPNPDKTVTVTISAGGDVHVVITHLENYNDPPTVTVHKKGDRTTTPVFENKVGKAGSGNTPARSEWTLTGTAATGPGTYVVGVECSADTFTSTVVAPAPG